MNQSGEDEQVSSIIADCMLRADAGQQVVEHEVLAAHPKYADELREYFDAERRLDIALGMSDLRRSVLSQRDTAGPSVSDSVQTKPKLFQSLPAEFGRYRIEKALGTGAMGAVFLAHDTQLRRNVALKIPERHVIADSEMRQRFYCEARSAALLNHPGICPVYDVGEIDGISFLTMAYINGAPLSELVSADNPLSCRQAASIVRKLALALHQAHCQGVIHRDLKPANVMLDQTGEPVVMDFGLALQVECVNRIRLTSVGILLGSPAYMSPEQVSGDPEAVAYATDIYSLGVILYELLSGRLPFEGSILSVIAQVATVDAPDIRTQRPDVDTSLAAICSTMMARSTSMRYSSMQQVADALAEYLSGHTHCEDSPIRRQPDSHDLAADEEISAAEFDNIGLDVAASKPNAIRPSVAAEFDSESRTPPPRRIRTKNSAVIAEAAVAKPTRSTVSKSTSMTLQSPLPWIGIAALITVILAAIVIQLRDGTTISIADGTAQQIELTTAQDGTLRQLKLSAVAESSTSSGSDIGRQVAAADQQSVASVQNRLPRGKDAATTFAVPGGATALAVAPDDRRFAVVNGSTPWKILINDVHTGSQVSEFPLPGEANSTVRHLSYSKDGKFLRCCAGRSWSLVDVQDGHQKKETTFPAQPAIAIFPERTLALAIYHEREVHRTRRREVPQRLRIWNWQSGQILYDSPFEFEKSPHSYPAISPDESFMTYAGEHCHFRCTLSFLDDTVSIGPAIAMEQTSRVRGPLVFSADGKYAATNIKSRHAMAVILDPNSGRIVCSIDAEAARRHNEGHIYGSNFAFTADSQRLVTAHHTGQVAVWDVSTGTLVRTLTQFRKSGNHAPPQIATTSDNHIIVAGGTADPRVEIQRMKE